MNYALITGATSGIGRHLAKELASRSCNLALLGRSEDKLKLLKSTLETNHSITVKYLVIDLIPENAADTVLSWLKNEDISIDVLINNAALAKWGRTEDISFEVQMNMIKLNQITLFNLCYKLLPLLRNASRSHILNIEGIGAFQPVPYFAVYAAGKSFVLSFSRALRHELANTGVKVSCLCHGPADTDFFSKAGFKKSSIANNKTVKMSAEDIALLAIEGMYKNKSLIVPGLSNKMGLLLSKCLPMGWMVKLGGFLFGK